MNIRQDFPMLAGQKPLIYLDSAASSLTPTPVLEAMQEYYTTYRANVHRTIHQVGEKATAAFEHARATIAAYINAQQEEIIFTRGTTESINLVARMLRKEITQKDQIILSQMEHHSNLLPWQRLARETGAQLRYIKVTKEGMLDMDDARSAITKNTKIVACTLMSNVLGTINDVRALAEYAHSVGAIMIVDAAQAMLHRPVDVQKLNCDVLCFSGHKMMGPTGIGVLYARKTLLEQWEPECVGGEMVLEVSWTSATWNHLPWKFEAGTPNIAGVIGLGAAVEYLKKTGIQGIQKHDQELTTYALNKLSTIPGIKIYGPIDAKKRGSLMSFTLEKIHPHDIAAVLDQEGIATRAGHLCAMPLVTQVLGVQGVCRASFAAYNTTADVDALCTALQKVQKVFA